MREGWLWFTAFWKQLSLKVTVNVLVTHQSCVTSLYCLTKHILNQIKKMQGREICLFPTMSSTILMNLLEFSVPCFSICKMGTNICYIYLAQWLITWGNFQDVYFESQLSMSPKHTRAHTHKWGSLLNNLRKHMQQSWSHAFKANNPELLESTIF